MTHSITIEARGQRQTQARTRKQNKEGQAHTKQGTKPTLLKNHIKYPHVLLASDSHALHITAIMRTL